MTGSRERHMEPDRPRHAVRNDACLSTDHLHNTSLSESSQSQRLTLSVTHLHEAGNAATESGLVVARGGQDRQSAKGLIATGHGVFSR